ncbi:Multidrug ABC transporter ATP-binding protein [Candidatus Electronema halotolerans]
MGLPSVFRAGPVSVAQFRYIALFHLVGPIFRRFRLRLCFGMAALLVVDLLQLTIPRYLKIGVDELEQGTADSHRLLLLCCFILLTAVVAAVLKYCWRTLLIGFSRYLETDLREQLFSHVLDMDQCFLNRHPPGEIMAHAANDLAAVQMAFGMGLAAAADILVLTGASVLFMLHISPPLTLTTLAPLPLLAACAWLLSRELHKRFEQVQAQFSLLTEFSRNTLVSIRMIKGCTREGQQIRDFDRLSRKYVRSSVSTAVMQGLLMPVSVLTGSAAMLIALYVGGRMVIANVITLGDFVAFTTFLSMLSMPLVMAGWVTGLLRRGLTSLARIHRLLTEESALAASLRPAPPGTAILQSRPRIALRQLSFTYPGAAAPALQKIELEIGPGVLGITGRTGSGKSTLCSLLVRLYPVPDQSFIFAGHDVNLLDPALIREQISYAGRTASLFSGTAAENISLARPEASLTEIKAAAKAAAVHEEILAMPDGYQTRLGERGVRLSGGQKQRLALARAILSHRPILIVDDGLSSLDADTSQQVFAALRERMTGKTLIVVTYQVSLLAAADHVLIMEQGRIADQGSHAQLLARNAFYQESTRGQQDRRRIGG